MPRRHATDWFVAHLDASLRFRKQPGGAKNGKGERYRVREQRKREDSAWKVAKNAWRQARQAYQAMTRAERKEQQEAYQMACQTWKTACQERQATLEQRQQENQAWHQANQELQSGSGEHPQTRSWIAILVITDQ